MLPKRIKSNEKENIRPSRSSKKYFINKESYFYNEFAFETVKDKIPKSNKMITQLVFIAKCRK